MPDCRMGSGVVKSGSPTPREMTFFIVAAISKNLRIPEGFRLLTRRESERRLISCIRPPTFGEFAIRWCLQNTAIQTPVHPGFALRTLFQTGPAIRAGYRPPPAA